MATGRTLTHHTSGITVRYLPGEVAVNVPYWHTGAEAESIVRAVYRVGRIAAEATGFAGYDPQLGLPLAEAESNVDGAVAVFDEAGRALSDLTAGEYFRVYFTGPVTLADAARNLRRMVVAEESDRFTVQWHNGPQMRVTFDAGPRIVAEAAEVADDYDLPEGIGPQKPFVTGGVGLRRWPRAPLCPPRGPFGEGLPARAGGRRCRPCRSAR